MLQEQGWRVIPVTRHENEVYGRPAYRRLADVPERIDVVVVFGSAYDPTDVGGLVDLVFYGLVGNPLTPTIVVDALGCPDVVGLFHDVAVTVDDPHVRHGAIFPRSSACLNPPSGGRARRAASALRSPDARGDATAR